MTHPWFQGETTPRILAHRGFVPPSSEFVAENSVAALAAARSTGTVYLESDCHLTADGAVALFHDDDLQRVTGDARKIAEVSSRELAEIMSTRGGLALLPDVLDAFPDARFNLDVKAAAAAADVGRLVARESHRVLITSFSDARRLVALDAARERGGEPATSAGTGILLRVVGLLAARLPRGAGRALDGIDALQVPERHRGIRIVSPRVIDLAHRHGVEVHVWTVNEAERMTALLDAGVDGIVTDRADIGVAVSRGRQ